MDDTACSPALKNPSPLAKKLKTICASRHSYKIASMFARHTGPTRQRPPESSGARSSSTFFSRLPYDVRMIIYSYLETGQPLAPRFECLGFYLSSQQSKREIEDFSRDRLRSLFATIENASGVKVAIKRGLDELRSITVVLPYTAFDNFYASSSQPKWKHEVLTGLHPLFAYPFDTLHIEISNEQRPISSIPKCETQDAWPDVTGTLRFLIRDLGSIVEYSNTSNLRAHLLNDGQNKVEKVFKPDGAKQVAMDPSTNVKARRICLSWDHRPFPRGRIQLSGRIIYAEEPRHSRKGKWQTSRKEKSWIPANLQTTMVYELSDAGCSVGEMGIVSPMRWPLYKPGGPSVTRILDAFDLRRGMIVLSEGLGMELENELAGVKVQELQDQEDRRHKAALERQNAAYARDFDDMVMRASIEEGYMPY
jgi:hypothetical protein